MDVQFTPDQKAFIREAIERGRFHRTEDAVQEAMSLWEERERLRTEIQAAIDTAEVSLERGKGRVITPASMRSLASAVKRRGRARLGRATPTWVS
jgi:Arc/MetJ-type ribon-helix-helix transcriptional regulator